MSETKGIDAQKVEVLSEEQSGMPNLAELLTILINQNMEQNAQSVNLLMNYMDQMEEQFTSVREELSRVKEQLTHVQDNEQTQGVKERLTALAEHTEKKLATIQEKITVLKHNLNEKAAQVVTSFKQKGISALHNVCDFLGIKEAMIEIRADLMESAVDMQKSMDKIDLVSSELREVITHAKNVGKALVGKEISSVPQAKAKGFFYSLKQPYLSMKGFCEKGIIKMERGIAKMEALEKAAGKSSQKKPSIKEKMEEMKKRQESKETKEPSMSNTKKQEATI